MNDFPRRMLATKDAALYCGVPRSYFSSICPARPVKLYENAHPRYDVFDLDKWIDSVKSGGKEEGSDDDIANRL